jgi:hypothetical protein
MKNFMLFTAVTALVLGGCKTSQLTSGIDDVYANPAEERAVAKAAAEQKKREEALKRQQEEEAMAKITAEEKTREAEKSKYYKDPVYDADDYYDYEYSARINRFYRPVYGAGFYDPYYTNFYTYNQNPAFWGTSIYNSYSWGMPSNQFGYYSFGISSGWGYNNWGYNNYNCGYYDPFCYNSGFYGGWGSGYNNWGYNNWAYNNGFYNGYNQGYYNGWNNSNWGYYNALDPNSNYSKTHYGPRNSNIGENSDRRREDAGRPAISGEREKYIQSVAEQQNNQPRFTGDRRIDNGARVSERREGERSSNSGRSGGGSAPVYTQPSRESSGNRRENSRRVEQQQPRHQESQQPRNSERNSGTWNPAPSNNGGGRGSSGDGGGSSPRGSGGGGNSRPRR